MASSGPTAKGLGLDDLLARDVFRFWKYVRRGRGCWEWDASKTTHGYGRLSICRKGVVRHCYAHHISWAIHFGPVPQGSCVCHHCDNPQCVRPDHLFLGDQKANMQDRDKKGRCRNGMVERGPDWRSPILKLTDADVVSILSSPLSSRELAEHYGVGSTTILDIKRGSRYSWVARQATSAVDTGSQL